MSEWISVKDRLPEDREAVFYYFDFVGVHAGHFTHEILDPDVFEYDADEQGLCASSVFYGNGGCLSDDVTHWMPRKDGDHIPEPPAMNQEG